MYDKGPRLRRPQLPKGGRMRTKLQRGITIREIIALAVCLIIATALASVLLMGPHSLARANALRAKDATQIHGIHQSILTFAREFEGKFPTPGLIKRKPDPVFGDVPGRGPEDESLNTTANLFSACI